jgi:hypothetical protein
MNEHDPLEEALAPLREIMPPESVRQRNRAAVREALEERVARAWWRRRVTVPLPLALAIAALLLVSASIHVIDALKTTLPAAPAGATQRAVPEPPALSQYAAWSSPSVQYSESQRYVSGVGVIDRSIVCQIQE